MAGESGSSGQGPAYDRKYDPVTGLPITNGTSGTTGTTSSTTSSATSTSSDTTAAAPSTNPYTEPTVGGASLNSVASEIALYPGAWTPQVSDKVPTVDAV